MAKKGLHIPRGEDNSSQYAEIRDSLINRIKNIENSGKIDNSRAGHVQQNNQHGYSANQFSNNNNYNQQNNVYHAPQANTFNNQNANQSMPFNQYQQQFNPPNHNNINQNSGPIQNFSNSQPFRPVNNQSVSNQESGPFAPIQQNSQPFSPVQQNNVYTQHSNNANAGFDTNLTGYNTAAHSTEEVIYKPKPKRSFGRSFLTLIIMIAFIFGLSWVLREFVFQAYEIPTGSMEKTIMTGDMVFAEKISHNFGLPKKGEIITFDDPLNPGRILIKRVIAVEGQTINIKNNKLYIDNVEQDEPYVNGLPTTVLKSSKISYPYIVPEGSIWVMGDNRTNSQDSRYFGAIEKNSVIGHALFVYWPFSNAKMLN